ncbi:MAG: GFA family protein [Beijerinckiaceae bacterium]
MAKGTLTGGCLCGWIRFEAHGKPGKPHTCSCKMCQRQTGALTTTWVEYPKEAVQWTGEGGMPATFRSSDFSNRAFCPKCGSAIGAIDDKPTIGLHLGVFDSNNRKDVMPEYHSYKGGRPKWWQVTIKSED